MDETDTRGPHDGDDAGGYTGPATVTVGDRAPVEVEVQLIGHFDPIVGRYQWQGRVRGLAEASDPDDPPITDDSEVMIATPHGTGEGLLSARDAFGGHLVRGVTAPPFSQLPDDEPIDEQPAPRADR